MSQEHTVIFTALSSQQAHLLRNLLSDAGIKAVVTNDVLDRGAGVGLSGWPTLARVLVAEEDALRARQLALEFDKRAFASPSGPVAEAPVPTIPVDAWPRCPQCAAPRITRCPVCQTAGTDFPLADMEFAGTAGPDEAGSAICPTRGPGGEEAEPEPRRVMLVCPTCDEAFVPEHPRVCEWCGHAFADGYELPAPEGPAEEISSRMITVVIALLALLAAVVAYFVLIV